MLFFNMLDKKFPYSFVVLVVLLFILFGQPPRKVLANPSCLIPRTFFKM